MTEFLINTSQHAEFVEITTPVQAAMLGSSVQVFIRAGKLQFGTWQGIYLGEFDGPRTRKIWVTIQ